MFSGAAQFFIMVKVFSLYGIPKSRKKSEGIGLHLFMPLLLQLHPLF